MSTTHVSIILSLQLKELSPYGATTAKSSTRDVASYGGENNKLSLKQISSSLMSPCEAFRETRNGLRDHMQSPLVPDAVSRASHDALSSMLRPLQTGTVWLGEAVCSFLPRGGSSAAQVSGSDYALPEPSTFRSAYDFERCVPLRECTGHRGSAQRLVNEY